MHILIVTKKLEVSGGHEAYISSQIRVLSRGGHKLTVVIQTLDDRGIDMDLFGPSVVYRDFDFMRNWMKDFIRGSMQSKASNFSAFPDVVFSDSRVPLKLVQSLSKKIPIIHFIHSPGDYCPSGTKYFQKSQQACSVMPAFLGCMGKSIKEGCFFDGKGDNLGVRGIVQSITSFFSERLTLLSLADTVVVFSSHVENELNKFFLDKKKKKGRKVRVLYPPIFTNSEKLADEQVDFESKKILFVGRLHYTKGVEDAIAILSLLPSNYSLTIVGDGPNRILLRQYAKKVVPQHRVQFLPWVDQKELDGIYQEHHLLIFPSKWPEPFGLTGPEAMGHGLPVVAYDVGGVRDWLGPSGAGHLVEAGNVVKLAEAVRKVLEHPLKYQQLKMKAKRIVEEKFSERVYLKNLEDIILQTLQNRKRIVPA